MYTYLMDNYDLWKIYDEDQERRRAVKRRLRIKRAWDEAERGMTDETI